MEENKKYPQSVEGNHFVCEDGTKSRVYAFVCDYKCDWALVGTGMIQLTYYFRHVNGKHDGPFSYADDYKNGFAVVKKPNDERFYYRDEDGKLSDGFYKAGGYSSSKDKEYPVAIVQEEKDGNYFFRDCKGKLSEPYVLIRPDRLDYYGIKNRGEKIRKITIEEVKNSISKNIDMIKD